MPFTLAKFKASLADPWQRLKPWVRRSLMGSAALLVGVPLIWATLPEAPPAEQVVSIPVSVRLPPRPTATAPTETATTPDTPAAPAPVVDNSAALRALLNTKIVLKPAPFPELMIAQKDGMLPRLGSDGTEPWRAYARPQGPVPAGAAKIAIVLLEAGTSERLTMEAIGQLPQQVTLAFDAYAPNLPDQINAARAAGHESLLDLPMEPETYPIDDPGPETLLTQISANENLATLRGFMAKAPGVFGLATSSGRQFVTESSALAPLLQDMQRRGLGWVDLTLKQTSATTTLAAQMKMPVTTGQIVLDDVLTRDRLQAQLDAAVAQAKKKGQAVIVARMYPLSLAMLTDFAATLPDQNVALVPVSALLAVPTAPATLPVPPAVTVPPHHE